MRLIRFSVPAALHSCESRLRGWWLQGLFPGRDAGVQAMSGREWLWLALLVGLAGGLLFHNLSYPLVEPDEGRYAEIGREMAATNDWVVPRFNGEPYLDKPPLFYWLVAASVGRFGAHEWAARLVPALATFLAILATFFFGRRILGTRRALLGGFALTLMSGVILTGRMLILDAVLALMVVVALFTAYEAVRGEYFRWRWWLISAGFCALGILVKGPVALALTVPPLAACGWLQQGPARPRFRHWCVYGMLSLLVVAPWFIAVSIERPEFPYYFFVNQHLVRYLGQEHHPQPIWFYVPVLLGGCLPWSALLFPLGWFLLSRRAELSAVRTPAMGFLVLCSGWCLAFFSLSRGKLPPYILPAMYPLALLLGCFFELLFFRTASLEVLQRVHRWIPRQTTVVLAFVWVGLIVWNWCTRSRGPLFGPFEVAAAAAGLMIAVGTCLFAHRLPGRAAWILCSMAGVCFLLEVTLGFLPEWSTRRSPFCRAQEIAPLFQTRDMGLAFLPEFGSLPFLFNHDGAFIHIARHSADELKDFLGKHPHSVFVADNDFPIHMVHLVLPLDMEVERYFNSGKTRFFLVRPRSPSDKTSTSNTNTSPASRAENTHAVKKKAA